jgi:hypothetical protein
MSGLGTPQGTSGGGGILNILGSLLSGLHQQNVNQESLKENKQDAALKQQEGAQQLQMNQLAMKQTNQQLQQNDMTIASTVKSGAQTDLKSLTQQMITDPSRAKDPAFIAKYNQLATASGQIPELTKTGAIDVDKLKPSFDTSPMATDPKQMAAFAQLPTSSQTAILAQYSNVPASIKDQKPWVTFKDQTARDKVTNQHIDSGQKNAILAHYDATREKYIDTETGLVLPAKAAEYRAGVALDASRSQAIVMTAGAAVTRAEAYTQRVTDLNNQFVANPTKNFGAARSMLSSSTSNLRSLRTSLDDAQKGLINAQLNSTDPSVIAEAQSTVDKLQTAVDAATDSDTSLRNSIQNNPQVSAQLGAASGKPAVNIPGGGGNKTVYSTSGGRPIVSKDGGKTWNYQ